MNKVQAILDNVQIVPWFSAFCYIIWRGRLSSHTFFFQSFLLCHAYRDARLQSFIISTYYISSVAWPCLAPFLASSLPSNFLPGTGQALTTKSRHFCSSSNAIAEQCRRCNAADRTNARKRDLNISNFTLNTFGFIQLKRRSIYSVRNEPWRIDRLHGKRTF